MSHHIQVGLPNLPLCTWWRTQSVGINHGMIYAPLLPCYISMCSVKRSEYRRVAECKTQREHKRRESSRESLSVELS